MMETNYRLQPVGFVRSSLRQREGAPNQGSKGAPDAWLDLDPTFVEALEGLGDGDDLIVITWLHQADRDILKVHPQGNHHLPLTGVFATRSPDRPNPLGLHRVTLRASAGHRLQVGPLEAIDGTPVMDIKPVLAKSCES